MPRSFFTVELDLVTVGPVPPVPSVMRLRMLATPGTTMVLSMELSSVSSALACLSLNTLMTMRSAVPWSMVSQICVRLSRSAGGPWSTTTEPLSLAGSSGGMAPERSSPESSLAPSTLTGFIMRSPHSLSWKKNMVFLRV